MLFFEDGIDQHIGPFYSLINLLMIACASSATLPTFQVSRVQIPVHPLDALIDPISASIEMLAQRDRCESCRDQTPTGIWIL